MTETLYESFQTIASDNEDFRIDFETTALMVVSFTCGGRPSSDDNADELVSGLLDVLGDICVGDGEDYIVEPRWSHNGAPWALSFARIPRGESLHSFKAAVREKLSARLPRSSINYFEDSLLWLLRDYKVQDTAAG